MPVAEATCAAEGLGMLRIRLDAETRTRVSMVVEGDLLDDSLAVLQAALDREQARGRHVRLDLGALRLVGCRAVAYLLATTGPQVAIERCPDYLRRWLDCERAARQQGGSAALSPCEDGDDAGARRPPRSLPFADEPG
jgi:hypothetical protein